MRGKRAKTLRKVARSVRIPGLSILRHYKLLKRHCTETIPELKRFLNEKG